MFLILEWFLINFSVVDCMQKENDGRGVSTGKRGRPWRELPEPLQTAGAPPRHSFPSTFRSECFSSEAPTRNITASLRYSLTLKSNLPPRLECFELSLGLSIIYLWNCCSSQQTCMRSKNCPRLDLKIKDIIQERYIFKSPLGQCHEPFRTANPAINCVVKNREEIWGFVFLQISSSRLLVLDHSSYIIWIL